MSVWAQMSASELWLSDSDRGLKFGFWFKSDVLNVTVECGELRLWLSLFIRVNSSKRRYSDVVYSLIFDDQTRFDGRVFDSCRVVFVRSSLITLWLIDLDLCVFSMSIVDLRWSVGSSMVDWSDELIDLLRRCVLSVCLISSDVIHALK